MNIKEIKLIIALWLKNKMVDNLKKIIKVKIDYLKDIKNKDRIELYIIIFGFFYLFLILFFFFAYYFYYFF